MSTTNNNSDKDVKKILGKLVLPLVLLAILFGMASLTFISETPHENGNSEHGIQKKDTLDKARHIGRVKLDTLKLLIDEIGWADKIKINTSTWKDKASFSIQKGVDKENFHRIFYNNMTIRYLEDFGDAYFELRTTGEDYGFSCAYFKKNEVEYVEIPFEFLLGIVNERGRQRAGN